MFVVIIGKFVAFILLVLLCELRASCNEIVFENVMRNEFCLMLVG